MDRLGPYTLEEEIGRGGMGIVYRGYDSAIGRAVAVKIIRPQQLATAEEDAQLKVRFAREAAAAGKLSHPNIVVIYQLGEESGLQYMAMEFVPGLSLEQFLTPGSAMGTEKALSILSQVADALDFAHAEGVVHRDIKPANILVRSDGKIKITDFGVARIASQTLTQAGVTMGTPSYMAPEQILASKVDGRADQFSLGVIAYQMLSGRKPFQADTGPALMYQIINLEPPPLSQINAVLPLACTSVLQRVLAKEPEQRYPSCSAFAQALKESFAASAQPPPLPPESQTARSRSRVTAGMPRQNGGGFRREIYMAVGLGILLAGLVIFLVTRRDTPHPAQAPPPTPPAQPAPSPAQSVLPEKPNPVQSAPEPVRQAVRPPAPVVQAQPKSKPPTAEPKPAKTTEDFQKAIDDVLSHKN